MGCVLHGYKNLEAAPGRITPCCLCHGCGCWASILLKFSIWFLALGLLALFIGSDRSQHPHFWGQRDCSLLVSIGMQHFESKFLASKTSFQFLLSPVHNSVTHKGKKDLLTSHLGAGSSSGVADKCLISLTAAEGLSVWRSCVVWDHDPALLIHS